MNWRDKISLGMKQIQEACQENKNWNDCINCPFGNYCTALMDAKLISPLDGIKFNNGDGHHE